MRRRFIALEVMMMVMLGLLLAGCGGGATSDPLANLNGEWQSTQSGKKIVINLAGENKTIKIDEQEMAVTVSNVDGDTVSLDAQDSAGQKLALKLIRMWNDEGSAFTLFFFQNGGDKEDLVRAKQS